MKETSGNQVNKKVIIIVAALGCLVIIFSSAFLAFKKLNDLDNKIKYEVVLQLLEAEAEPIHDYVTDDDEYNPEIHTIYKVKALFGNKSNYGYVGNAITVLFLGNGERMLYSILEEDDYSDDIQNKIKHWNKPYIPANAQGAIERMVIVEKGCKEITVGYGFRGGKVLQQLTINL